MPNRPRLFGIDVVFDRGIERNSSGELQYVKSKKPAKNTTLRNKYTPATKPAKNKKTQQQGQEQEQPEGESEDSEQDQTDVGTMRVTQHQRTGSVNVALTVKNEIQAKEPVKSAKQGLEKRLSAAKARMATLEIKHELKYAAARSNGMNTLDIEKALKPIIADIKNIDREIKNVDREIEALQS